jgi:hypothetical protein
VLLPQIEAELAKRSPPIELARMDDLVAFGSSTWEPILKARVNAALACVFDHGSGVGKVRPVA